MCPLQPEPDQETEPTQQSAAWRECHGLTLHEAEHLLDWLEAHGVARREVVLAEGGVTVRWQE
jgi:hypothetical protein